MLQVEARYTREEAAAKTRTMGEGSLRKAALEGDVENGAIMIGQIVPLLTAVRPAREIIESTIRECNSILRASTDLGL